MGGGLESRCVVRVYGADGAVHRHFTLFHEEDALSNNPHCNERFGSAIHWEFLDYLKATGLSEDN